MSRTKNGALTPKQARFVEEYMVDLNGHQAALRAGYSERSAMTIARDLAANPRVQAAIQAAQAERAERVGMTADQVLKDLWSLAQADSRQLVEYRRNCCRYCWGEGYRYQRTAGEMERDKAVHLEQRRAGKKVGRFDPKGGIGYHGKRPPNQECPECFGDGIGEPFVHDTRNLPPEVAKLYAGVKVTREGIEVKAHSQVDALVNVGRHLGMFPNKTELTGKDGKPLIPTKKTDLTDDELAAIASRRGG